MNPAGPTWDSQLEMNCSLVMSLVVIRAVRSRLPALISALRRERTVSYELGVVIVTLFPAKSWTFFVAMAGDGDVVEVVDRVREWVICWSRWDMYISSPYSLVPSLSL